MNCKFIILTNNDFSSAVLGKLIIYTHSHIYIQYTPKKLVVKLEDVSVLCLQKISFCYSRVYDAPAMGAPYN